MPFIALALFVFTFRGVTSILFAKQFVWVIRFNYLISLILIFRVCLRFGESGLINFDDILLSVNTHNINITNANKFKIITISYHKVQD